MAVKKQNLGRGTGVARKHFCRDHDQEVKPVMFMPGRRMVFQCESGCSLSKKDTVLK